MLGVWRGRRSAKCTSCCGPGVAAEGAKTRNKAKQVINNTFLNSNELKKEEEIFLFLSF
jgi:hypothetical protein